MHDNDSFRLIDPDLAVGLFCAGVAVAALLGAFPEPPVAKSTKAAIHCDVKVAQYGPGERWHSSSPRPPACAGAVVSAPNHILTYPLPEAK